MVERRTDDDGGRRHMAQMRSGFSDVDRTEDPEGLVRFLDVAASSEFFSQNRRLRLERLALSRGDSVLEIGCGTGEVVREIGDLVGGEGRAVGVDFSALMLARARERSSGALARPD